MLNEQQLQEQLRTPQGEGEFFARWLELQSPRIGGVRRAAVFLADRDQAFVAVAAQPAGFRPGAAFHSLVEQVRAEGRELVVKIKEQSPPEPQTSPGHYLAMPVMEQDLLRLVVVFEISERSAASCREAMGQLCWGLAWPTEWLSRRQCLQEQERWARRSERLQGVLELAARSLDPRDGQAAALASVTILAERLACDRVGVGLVEGRQVKLVAVSNTAQFDRQLNLSRALADLMNEGVDQQETLIYPPADAGRGAVLQQHRAYVQHYGAAALLTIPFVDVDGVALGAYSFERAEEQPFSGQEVDLCEAVVALVGPTLVSKHLNDRSWLRTSWDCLRSQWGRLAGPGNIAWKGGVLAALLLVLVCLLAGGEYRVAGDTTLEGTVQRVVIAPFDGFLDEALHRPGDLVEQGAVLARMETRELVLERINWNSQSRQHQLEYHRAVAENQVAHSRIIEEQVAQAGARIALLDQQISRAAIRAPFAGLIIRGDLSQAIGAPVKYGQVLFEIAPLDAYRVVIEVDEREIEQVCSGQKGRFLVNALPQESFPFVVTRVTPVSRVSKGRTVFRVEGALGEQPRQLRPGMQGLAKISIGQRSLLWLWSHELLNRLRLWLWAVLP